VRAKPEDTAKSERCFKQDICCNTVTGKSKDRGGKTAGTETMQSSDFVVMRNDLQQCKFINTQLPDAAALPDDALLIKVDRFAFTANNITYAVLGDELKYWQLFPAPEKFGNVPVWGFGEVIASRHPDIAAGERLFGYFPMATHLVIEAAGVSKRGLRDGAAHRQGVAPVYNAYARVSGDPAFAGRQGDYQALLRPLFMLSFLVDDFLAENEFFGAKRVMLSSASSKTAFGLAHLLHTRRKGIKTIGLTSAGNAGFVSSLGCYDEVVTYDRVTSLPSDAPVALVDMAGDSELRAKLHRHFGDEIKYSGRVGLTHRSSLPDEPELPGAKPAWFFAPDQIRKRAKEWGPGGVDIRFAAAWSGFAPMLDQWLTVIEGRGERPVQQVYLDTLNGHVPPDQGHILSLQSE
jgi:Protein of unknown function (DUF2855)